LNVQLAAICGVSPHLKFNLNDLSGVNKYKQTMRVQRNGATNRAWELKEGGPSPSLSNVSPPEDVDDTHGRVVVDAASRVSPSSPGSSH
jgi:hypothetical protein